MGRVFDYDSKICNSVKLLYVSTMTNRGRATLRNELSLLMLPPPQKKKKKKKKKKKGGLREELTEGCVIYSYLIASTGLRSAALMD